MKTRQRLERPIDEQGEAKDRPRPPELGERPGGTLPRTFGANVALRTP